MQKKRRTPGKYALDGFVPRPTNRARRRVAIDTMRQQPPINNEVNSQRSRRPSPLVMKDDVGSLSQPIDMGDLPPVEKSPHFWQFRKKRNLRKNIGSSRRKKVVKRISLIFLLIILIIGGFLGWKVVKNTARVFNGNVLGLLNSTKLKGEDVGRVNILLAGNSQDDPGHDGADLTDSIMLVSIDTKDNTAFMMSIPRDLWVSYQTKDCDVGYAGKINAAYTCGEQTNFSEPGYPKGGMGLLEKVIHDNFGVNINYYALINYGAFRDSVNAVNSITINLKTDDPRGIYDTTFDWECHYKCHKVDYPNGPVTLNGDQALDLARARGDFGGYGSGNDFGRAQRQRQMLVALKDKALSAGVLSNPSKLSSLLDSIGKNVTTDVKTSEVRRMYDIGKNIKNVDISSIGLADDDVNMVTTGMYNGQSIVRPVAGIADFSQIKLYMQRLTSNNPAVREGARIVVLNGSGTSGLAQKQADTLIAKGINVTQVANAQQDSATTHIIDLSKGTKNATKKLLESYFKVIATTDTTTYPGVSNYSVDFVVILGQPASASQTN